MAAADMAVTSAGAGDNSGNGWANAMTIAEFETDVEGACEAGDRYFFMGGQTYTETQNIVTGRDGSITTPIEIIGVASGTTAWPPTSDDWAVGSDRPLIAAGAWDLWFGDYWRFRNLQVTTTDPLGFIATNYCSWFNCKVTNTSVGANSAIYSNGTYAWVVNCEAVSTLGNAIYFNLYGMAFGCYAHNSLVGIARGVTSTLAFNIVDTCTTGIGFGANFGNLIVNNTLSSGTTGIFGTTSNRNLIMNNIIAGFTTPATFTAEYPTNVFNYNNWYNSATPTNVTKGPNAMAVDPLFANPAAADPWAGFLPGNGANMIGFPGSGLVCGAVQPVAGAAGGGRSSCKARGVW